MVYLSIGDLKGCLTLDEGVDRLVANGIPLRKVHGDRDNYLEWALQKQRRLKQRRGARLKAVVEVVEEGTSAE
jgi:hypothetical protein